ncbi:MAG: hypothetical protein QXL93_02940 [Candidatus Nitrosocaldus sp.]
MMYVNIVQCSRDVAKVTVDGNMQGFIEMLQALQCSVINHG